MKKRYRLPPPASQPAFFFGPAIELHAEDDRYPSNGTIEAVWVEPKLTAIDLRADVEQATPRNAEPSDNSGSPSPAS